MANASRFNQYVSYVAESTPGTTPGSPSMKKFRTTDATQITTDREQNGTEETYSHRQVPFIRMGFKSVGGSLPFELSYGAFDDWFEALTGGSWSTETPGTPEVLKIGNGLETFTVERGAVDIAQYEVFRGVTPNSLTLNVDPQGNVTGQFGLVGMDYDPLTGTSLGSPADVANNPPVIGSCDAEIQEGGNPIAIVTSLNFQVDNGRIIQRLVGSCGGDAPTNGAVNVTGTMVARFQDEVLKNKFIHGTDSSLMVKLNDPGGSQYIQFDFPKIKYTGGNEQADQDTLDVNLPFAAQYDETENSGFIITRSNAS